MDIKVLLAEYDNKVVLDVINQKGINASYSDLIHSIAQAVNFLIKFWSLLSYWISRS